MGNLQNISHIYRGLLKNSRAFASFREIELDIVYSDLSKYISYDEFILDPMSGYGGGMVFLGGKGYKTTNIELNPPAYFWQLLINPQNTQSIIKIIKKLLNKKIELPKINETFSLTDNLFSDIAINHIKLLFSIIYEISNKNKILSISLLLPFVSRFANYVKSPTNITHFKQGGLCSYLGWEQDFHSYLEFLSNRLSKDYISYKQQEHKNILADIFQVKLSEKYRTFVTSPPYPNYRDYSKLFKIENYVLDNIILNNNTNFEMMIGSNNVSGKTFGTIQSEKANLFLTELLAKAEKLKVKNKKSCSDIKTYYHPYFAQYFYNIQEAYRKLDSMLTNNSIGYIVVNDNITRDIIVPVGASICDIFNSMGYESKDLDTSQISHYGNIGRSATRMNSKHTRHILKVWKQ
ncbi:MAG: hypothetical protein LBF69_07440 [Prevotellaceae bacterium]|jgi:mRNA-degrading endonuclease YafQ of YafQ-DinJ toxin-antitoxin module|nr:hypothetical protein [Prevotellaceae bacterium]